MKTHGPAMTGHWYGTTGSQPQKFRSGELFRGETQAGMYQIPPVRHKSNMMNVEFESYFADLLVLATAHYRDPESQDKQESFYQGFNGFIGKKWAKDATGTLKPAMEAHLMHVLNVLKIRTATQDRSFDPDNRYIAECLRFLEDHGLEKHCE